MARVWLTANDKIQQRLRFEDDEGYQSRNGIPKAFNRSRLYSQAKQCADLNLKTIAALFIASAVASWMIFHYVNAEDTQFGDRLQPVVVGNQTSEGTKFYDFLAALAIGGGTTLHTWMITYLDSKHPGMNPPTPSPRKCRRGRYVEFHLSYMMAIANGIVFFCIYLWG